MKQLQLKDLYQLCLEQMKAGNGNKFLVLSNDNEGNAYHGMFYGITPITKAVSSMYRNIIWDSKEMNTDNLLIIG